MMISRVEQHLINKNHKLFNLIDSYSFKTKNLYNLANYYTRQIFIMTSKIKDKKELTEEQLLFLQDINIEVDNYNLYKQNNLEKAREKAKTNKTNKSNKTKKVRDLSKDFIPLKHFGEDHKWVRYDFINFLLCEAEAYNELMSQVAQQTLRQLDKNWKSFFVSIKEWKVNPSKFTGRPKLPKYKHKTRGRSNIYFTNQNCSLKEDSLKEENYIQFPKEFNKYLLKTKISGDIKQVRIKPLGSRYLIEIVYDKEIKEQSKANPKKIISIDLGVNNFATITNNIGLQPIVINGGVIKSINQCYNKGIAKYKSILKTNNGKDWSKRLSRITNNRNNKIKDLMHKSSRFVIDYSLENGIDTIIIGKNKYQKQGINTSKKNNQNIVGIPYNIFIQQLQYKALEVGITVILSEESYTSKASFLDNDFIPTYNKNNTIKHKFSGRRIRRGMYKSKNGILINADVNGSYNIMRKVVPNAFAVGIVGVGLHPIKYDLS